MSEDRWDTILLNRTEHAHRENLENRVFKSLAKPGGFHTYGMFHKSHLEGKEMYTREKYLIEKLANNMISIKVSYIEIEDKKPDRPYAANWREKYEGYESPLKLFDIKDFYEFHHWLKCSTTYYE